MRGPITVINHTKDIWVELTKGLPVGTNRALLLFLWMMVSEALLLRRDPLFPALQATGLHRPGLLSGSMSQS